MATPIIYMDHLFLKSVHWSFEDINLQISSCLFGSAHLKIYKNLFNESHAGFYEDLYVSINDSSLGNLRADSVSKMLIRNSYINGRYTESSSSFFITQNSNVTIINSTFTNNIIEFNSTQPTLLNASIHSHITLHNCLVSGNRGYVSIIQVTNQSFIHLINSVISYNRISNESRHKYSIVNFEDSFVSAVNCTFTHNQLVSSTNSAVVSIIFISRIFIENCTFTNNQGSTIYATAIAEGKLNVTNCYFAENNYTDIDKGTLNLFGSHTLDANAIFFYFFNCTFTRNYAYDGGGVIAWSTIVYFKKCIFKENEAFTAGAVDLLAANASFENCEFLANKTIFQVGVIYGQGYSSLVIMNCSFENNRGITSAGAVKVYGPSELRVWRSVFTNNTPENRAGTILLEQNVISDIVECRFIKNSAVHYDCIGANSNITLRINGTHFINNTAKDAMVFSQDNVTIKILFSKFEHNQGGNCIEVHENSSLVVVHSEFSENSISQGSVIYVDLNSNVAARNSTFFNHSTEVYGAVIYGSQNCNKNLTKSKLSYNQAKFGGAIYVANCTLKIIDSMLDSNNAIDGGVIYGRFASVFLKNSSCSRNFAKSYGGCLYAATSNVSLKFSNISFNQAFAGGAVIVYSNSDFNALKTKFCNNTAVTNGGAIYQPESGHTALDQCSLRYNRVDDAYSKYGSDIRRMEGYEVRISPCEFVHNAADKCTALSFNRRQGNDSINLITLKTNISYGSLNLSTGDPLFLKKAAENNWIYCNGGYNSAVGAIKQNETHYASCTYLKCSCLSFPVVTFGILYIGLIEMCYVFLMNHYSNRK